MPTLPFSTALTLASPILVGALVALPAGAQLAGDGKDVAVANGVNSRRSDATVEQVSRQLSSGRLVLAGVRFVAGSDRLDGASAPQVELLAAALRATTGVFAIEAHVPAGTGAQALAMRRAAALQARLVAAGVESARLLATGTVGPRASPGVAREPSSARDPDAERVEIARLH